MDDEHHTGLLPAFKEYISVMDSKKIFLELAHLI